MSSVNEEVEWGSVGVCSVKAGDMGVLSLDEGVEGGSGDVCGEEPRPVPYIHTSQRRFDMVKRSPQIK